MISSVEKSMAYKPDVWKGKNLQVSEITFL
jgi:hypothetical protein